MLFWLFLNKIAKSLFLSCSSDLFFKRLQTLVRTINCYKTLIKLF